MQPQIKVLVIDDSAVVRQLLTALLPASAGFSVETAADVPLGRRKMAERRPDVLVLDIELPGVNGLTFLAELMANDPLPVVICSAHAGSGTASAIRALELGAVAVLEKPRIGVRDFFQESAMRVVDTVREAAQVKRFRRVQPMATRAPIAQWRRVAKEASHVIAIGASTGGTEAIHTVLRELPSNCPAVMVVIHMPAGFTSAFAARLDSLCAIGVREAKTGEPLLEGNAYVAPGDQHMKLARRNGRLAVQLSAGPPVSHHRPSVDVLFQSVADVAGANAMGVLLTGMGEDGATGLLAMRQRGALTVAQDEATSVVFGMPRHAIECGAAEAVLPIDQVGFAIRRWAGRAVTTR